jgi:hypothetical protein
MRAHVNYICLQPNRREHVMPAGLPVSVLVSVFLIFAACVSGQTIPNDKQGANSTTRCDIFGVAGPTVIAFLDPTDSGKDPQFTETLLDFQRSIRRVRVRFESKIRARECYQSSFEVRVGGARRRFVAKAQGVGYYFVSPRQEPRIEYGVITDDDLIDVMKEYFGVNVVDRATKRN